jgi:hypothetical protein
MCFFLAFGSFAAAESSELRLGVVAEVSVLVSGAVAELGLERSRAASDGVVVVSLGWLGPVVGADRLDGGEAPGLGGWAAAAAASAKPAISVARAIGVVRIGVPLCPENRTLR